MYESEAYSPSSMAEARQLTQLLEQLQRKRKALGDQDRSQVMLTAPGGAGVAPAVRVNYAGIIGNAMDSYKRAKLDTELEDTGNRAEEARRRILAEVMGSEGGITPEKILQLNEAGVDPATLKLIQPEKVSKGAMYQALAQNPALAPLFVGQGLIDQGTADSLLASFREQKALDKQDKIDIAAAGRSISAGSGRAETDAEWFQRDPDGYRAYIAAKNSGKTTGKSASGKMTTEEINATLDYNLGELQKIVESPKLLRDVSSTEQGMAKVLRDQGGVDNPSILQGVAGLIGTKMRSPAAARLDRMAADNAFGIVQKLYPASNSDVQLAKAQFAQVGESPAAIKDFYATMRRIQNKVRSGELRVVEDGESGDPPAPTTRNLGGKSGWNIQLEGGQ